MTKHDQKEPLNEIELELVSGGAQGFVGIGQGGAVAGWKS